MPFTSSKRVSCKHGIILGFGLVCTPLGKSIVGLFFFGRTLCVLLAGLGGGLEDNARAKPPSHETKRKTPGYKAGLNYYVMRHYRFEEPSNPSRRICSKFPLFCKSVAVPVECRAASILLWYCRRLKNW